MAVPSLTTIAYAVLGGVLPTLLWLWFWLRRAKDDVPGGLKFLSFVMGALMVLFIIPLQRIIAGFGLGTVAEITVWASLEEVAKYGAVALVAFGSRYIRKPIDYPMILITGALGFAALENTFFLLDPLATGSATVSLVTGNLRFLGSTLLHALASAIVGIFMGISLREPKLARRLYALSGLILASTLHAVFNFFIMGNEQRGIWTTLGFIWVVGVIVVLLLEKLKRVAEPQPPTL